MKNIIAFILCLSFLTACDSEDLGHFEHHNPGI